MSVPARSAFLAFDTLNKEFYVGTPYTSTTTRDLGTCEYYLLFDEYDTANGWDVTHNKRIFSIAASNAIDPPTWDSGFEIYPSFVYAFINENSLFGA